MTIKCPPGAGTQPWKQRRCHAAANRSGPARRGSLLRTWTWGDLDYLPATLASEAKVRRLCTVHSLRIGLCAQKNGKDKLYDATPFVSVQSQKRAQKNRYFQIFDPAAEFAGNGLSCSRQDAANGGSRTHQPIGHFLQTAWKSPLNHPPVKADRFDWGTKKQDQPTSSSRLSGSLLLRDLFGGNPGLDGRCLALPQTLENMPK